MDRNRTGLLELCGRAHCGDAAKHFYDGDMRTAHAPPAHRPVTTRCERHKFPIQGNTPDQITREEAIVLSVMRS